MDQDNQTPSTEGQPTLGNPTNLSATGDSSIDWRQAIPEEYRDAKLWEPLQDKDLGTVLKGYAEAQRRLGNSVSIPQEDDQDGWNKFYSRLGRPESFKQYEYQFPDSNVVEWDQAGLEEFADLAHKAGLSQSQFKAVMDYQASQLLKEAEAEAGGIKDEMILNESRLKEEYGSNYNYAKALAGRAMNHYAGEDIPEDEMAVVLSDPKWFRALSKLGTELKETGTFGEVSPSNFGGLTWESAQDNIKELQNADKATHPYWNEKLPGHEDAVAKAHQWFKVQKPQQMEVL